MIQALNDKDIPALVTRQFPEGFKGYALEIGASDGFYLSNTLALERAGWSVLCIEPNLDYFARLQTNRKLALNVACSDHNAEYQDLLVYDRLSGQKTDEPVSALGGLDPSFVQRFCPDVSPPRVEKVSVRTLDWCLESVSFPRLDYLSLDVDGLEAEILKGFDILRWETKVAVVENPFLSPEIKRYFKSAAFDLIGKTHVNEIWVRREK